MRKGFIFSVDAALALLLVIGLAFALAAGHGTGAGKAGVFSSIAAETRDAAIVGLYLGKDAGDFGLSGSFDKDAGEFVKCNYSYELDPNNGFSEAVVNEKKFCGEK